MKSLLRKAIVATTIVLAAIGQISAKERNNQIVTKNMQVSDFHGIDVSTGINVRYSTGKTAMKVSGKASLIDYFEASVEDGILCLEIDNRYFDKNNSIKGGDIEVVVSSSSLDWIEASSGGYLSVTSPLETKGKFAVDISSGAKCELQSVKCAEFEADASSGCSFSIGKLVATDADIDLSSGCNMDVDGCNIENLNIDASSGCGISMAGTCKKVVVDASSGSNVNLRNLKSDTATVDASSACNVKTNSKKVDVDKDITVSVKNYND